MACIAKRRGRYVLDYYDNRGKRRWQTLPKGTTLKQAKGKLREIENQLAKGIFIPIREVPTFKNVAEDWLLYKKANIRGSTWNMYNSHLTHHFDMVNNLKISKHLWLFFQFPLIFVRYSIDSQAFLLNNFFARRNYSFLYIYFPLAAKNKVG